MFETLKNRLIAILRSSEKYTHTDMVYLASGGFWSVLAQIIAALSTFALAMIVARFVSKDAYGQYKYILATLSLITSFSLTGASTAVFQSVSRGFEGTLFEGFTANLRWSILIFIGSFATAAYYFYEGNATLAFGLLIGGSLTPLLNSANLATAFLNGKKDFRRSSLYFGALETFVSTGIIIAAIFIMPTPLALTIAYFAGNLLATYLFYRRVIRVYKPSSKKKDPGMLAYAKHLSVMNVLTGIAGNIDQVLLFHYVGPVDLAIYNFATAIPDQAKGPLKMLDSMVQARFANRSDTEIRTGMRNKMLWIFISAAALIVLYILLAPPIYALFFPAYGAAVLYSQIYAASYLADSLNPAASYLSVKKKVREQYIASTGLSIFRILALFVGVVYGGLMGVIIVRIIVRTAGTVTNYFLYLSASRKMAIS